MKPLLLCLTLLPTLRPPSGSSYFAELAGATTGADSSPGTSFSTVVAFVREAVSNASSSGAAPGAVWARRTQPVPADSLSARKSRSGSGRCTTADFDARCAGQPVRSRPGSVNQRGGWLQRALVQRGRSSIVASDSRVFGCYVWLLNDSSVLETVPHAFRHAIACVLIENYAQRVSIAGPPSPRPAGAQGFEMAGWRQQSHQIAPAVASPPPSEPGLRMKDQTSYLQPFTSGLLRLLDTRGEDGGLGGQVKV
uniref:Secreted protein n=1 Tax=Macrostomum lignano TaxID=282301 RepID=A0A1I8F437_9PLAT